MSSSYLRQPGSESEESEILSAVETALGSLPNPPFVNVERHTEQVQSLFLSEDLFIHLPDDVIYLVTLRRLR